MTSLLVSAAAFLLLLASSVPGYYSYRKKSSTWKKYFFFCTLGMAFFQAVLFLGFFFDSYVHGFSELPRLTAEMLKFVFAGVVLYAFPICIINAFGRVPSWKMKLLLFTFSGSVLLFGTIALIWNKERLSRAVELFFYLYLLVFSCAGIFRQRVLYRDRRKRPLVVLLYFSILYFLWAILAGYVPQTEFPYGHAAYTALWGGIFLVSDCLFLNRRKGNGKSRRAEIFEEAGISSEEADIVEMMERGMSNTEIGSYLSIDDKSLDTYIYSIYKKLKVNNRIELFKKLDRS